MGERGAARGGPGRAGRGFAANRSAGFGWPVAGGGGESARTRVPGAGRGRRALWEGGGPGAHGGAGQAGMGPEPPVPGPSAEPPPPLALHGPAVGPRRVGRALAAAGMAAQGGAGSRTLQLVLQRSEPSAGARSGPGPSPRGTGPARPRLCSPRCRGGKAEASPCAPGCGCCRVPAEPPRACQPSSLRALPSSHSWLCPSFPRHSLPGAC